MSEVKHAPRTLLKKVAPPTNQSFKGELDFFATTAKGMEHLLEAEIKALGGKNVEAIRAGVGFSGNLKIAYKICLWSRIANRVLMPLKTFPAPTPEKLYGGVKSIKWSDHLNFKQTLAIDFSTSRSQIDHSRFGAQKTKDAICDQLKSVQGDRPSVDVLNPQIRINVYLHEDIATVSLDLSGNSLHMRGYRDEATPAPLKENLAAALLQQAGWREGLDPEFCFLDPMCGSGTLPIEAAMISAKIPPGFAREFFGFTRWIHHDRIAWKELKQEAEAGVIRDKKALPKIIGYDAHFRAVALALKNLERAGVHGLVHIEKRELSAVERIGETGILLMNPPYGERLGEVEALIPLYEAIGDTFKQHFKGWTGHVFTGSPELSKKVGLRAAQKIAFFNGPIECRLMRYELF